ncbi:PPIase cyclophilin-type domain-containing protein [Pycnococcus provasolii]
MASRMARYKTPWTLCACEGIAVNARPNVQAVLYYHLKKFTKAELDSFIAAIAAGGAHSLALRRNGGVACWGWNNHGQAPPAGVEGDFVAIAAGSRHSLALRRNGTSVAC